MTKKALIIGATGAIGNSLTQQLLDNDNFHQVVTFTRKPQAVSHAKLSPFNNR